MILNEIRPSSADLSLIQPVYWSDSSARESAVAAVESEGTGGEQSEFIRLTDTIRATLSGGGTGALALVRVRTARASGKLPYEKPAAGGSADENTPLRLRTLLEDLDIFLAPRLDPVRCPVQGRWLKSTAGYGAFTLLVWQPGYTAAELANRLQRWRTDYHYLKRTDFVAGIAAAPEAGTDLLHLLFCADEALTEAHSTRQVICFDQATTDAINRQKSRPQTILIVDDNRDQVEVLDLIMRQNSYETLRAYSGEQALEAISHYRPDLLLLDVGMPQLDGFYVLSRLRDLSGGRLSLPVIMITGSDTEESVRRGFELGARDYVIKPCDPRDLLTRIHSILSASSKR